MEYEAAIAYLQKRGETDANIASALEAIRKNIVTTYRHGIADGAFDEKQKAERCPSRLPTRQHNEEET